METGHPSRADQEPIPLLAQLTRRVKEQTIASTRLREAIVRLLESPVPVFSVAELARSAGCSRATLYRDWQRCFPGMGVVSLKDFMDSILLVHAIHVRQKSKSWEAAASELQIERPRLSRLSARLLKKKLNELTVDDVLGSPPVRLVLRGDATL